VNDIIEIHLAVRVRARAPIGMSEDEAKALVKRSVERSCVTLWPRLSVESSEVFIYDPPTLEG